MDKIEKIKSERVNAVINAYKINELVEESNDLREAYHSEMNALAGLVNGLEERIEKLENATKADTGK